MKKTILRLLTVALLVATLVGPASVVAADDSPNAIPSKQTSEKKKAEKEKTTTEKEKTTTTTTTKKKNNLGIDFSLNMKPAKAQKKVTPKYGLLADGGYERSGFTEYGLSERMRTKNYPSTSGAKQKTEKESRIYFVNGVRTEITYDSTMEYRKFDEMGGHYFWTILSPDPLSQVPLGYAVATGHLKVSDLPANVREWHDAGGYDNVIYWPVLDEYSYSADISLDLAMNLGLFKMSDLTAIEQQAFKAGSAFSYMPFKARVYESGMDVNLAIKKGFLTKSEMPAEARKVLDDGGSVTYSISQRKFRWVSM